VTGSKGKPRPARRQEQREQRDATKGGTPAGPRPASGAAAPPAAAAADFLAGLERQLADATARSAGDGGLDATAAVVADIQQQLLALKQQLLSVQQHQQQQPVSAAPPGVHVSSSSGDQLSPYAGPALQGGHLRPSPPLPAWQLQPLGAFHPGPAHQPPPAAASPRQVRYGQPASPSRHHTSTTSLGRHAGRLPSRSPSPKRRRPWQEPLRGELPLVPVAVRHFKHGGFISWELVGQVVSLDSTECWSVYALMCCWVGWELLAVVASPVQWNSSAQAGLPGDRHACSARLCAAPTPNTDVCVWPAHLRWRACAPAGGGTSAGSND